MAGRMMGRVTLQDHAVVLAVGDNFVATWVDASSGLPVEERANDLVKARTGARPWDRGGRDRAVGWASVVPQGQARDNVAVLLATARGELLHIVPGFWSPRLFLRELAFARKVSEAVTLAGSDPEARRHAARDVHRRRLLEIKRRWSRSDLGTLVLEGAHESMVKRPLRSIEPSHGFDDLPVGPLLEFRSRWQQIERLASVVELRGIDLAPLRKNMDRFEPLVEAGKIDQARITLDDALRWLAATRCRAPPVPVAAPKTNPAGP